MQTHIPHQSDAVQRGNIEVFAFELTPDLAHSVEGEGLIEDATNLDLQSGILPGARRPLGRIAPLGHMGIVVLLVMAPSSQELEPPANLSGSANAGDGRRACT
ncbi:hypothetical protein ACVWXL_009278 [Bradyrhizobium sp. GM22.5]